MKIKEIYRVLILTSLILQSCQDDIRSDVYLDAELPVDRPRLFAPSIVNTDSIEINAVFNNTFDEVFFTRIVNGKFLIHHSTLQDGKWTTPTSIQMFKDKNSPSVAIDPSVSPNGQLLYFLGISPEDYKLNGNPDIYVSQKIEGKWQLAKKVELSTKEHAESYPVVVDDGSLYFQSDRDDSYGKRDIYRSQFNKNGGFDLPKNMGTNINTAETERSTYVSSDESFMIKVNNSNTDKGFDISFKQDGQWQGWQSMNLRFELDSDWIYCCPYMSPDGKYFFFSRRLKSKESKGWSDVIKGEVYWMSAEFSIPQNIN